ncbi:Respiratory burst oxidase-like protein C [Diplonema papillatum]|nr:Respiratory burst oxidase-like protein C [Diplonema papillatum]
MGMDLTFNGTEAEGEKTLPYGRQDSNPLKTRSWSEPFEDGVGLPREGENVNSNGRRYEDGDGGTSFYQGDYNSQYGKMDAASSVPMDSGMRGGSMGAMTTNRRSSYDDADDDDLPIAPPGLPPAPPEGLDLDELGIGDMPILPNPPAHDRTALDREQRMQNVMAQQELSCGPRDPTELFKPHGKRFDELPAWKHLRTRSMLQSARQAEFEGRDLETERQIRWTEVVREPYSNDIDCKVRALLKLGFTPSVLAGIREQMIVLDEAIATDDELKGDKFSAVVTKMQQLLGLKGETAELLLTTRAMDPHRVMENSQFVSTAPNDDAAEAGDEVEMMKTGSRDKPVVTYPELLDSIIIFTPIGSYEEKLDLLFEMFDSNIKDMEYISMEDVQRLLTWLRKEADYSVHSHQDVVDVMYQRLVRDYIRALREENWGDDLTDDSHPDELLLQQMKDEGLHRYVLEQILLCSEKGGRVRIKPGTEVIVQNVKSKDLNGRRGKVIKKDPRQKGFMIVQFGTPTGEKHIKTTNLRSAPGVEKRGDTKPDAWGMYAKLNLNIRPKMETDPALVKKKGIVLVRDWLSMHLKMILFLTTLIVMFGLVLYFRYYRREEVRSLLGAAAGMSGASAWVLRFLMALTMISGCQGFLSKLPKRFQVTSRMSWVHMTLAAGIVLFTLIHIAAASDVFVTIKDSDPARVNAVLGTNFATDSSISSVDLIVSTPGWTGFAMIAVIIFMGLSVSSHQESWLFWIGHKMYIPLVGLLIVHSFAGWLEWEYMTLMWFAIPFLILVFEAFINIVQRIPLKAEVVATVRGVRGNTGGIEFRVKRPEGRKMAQQQAGEYLEVMATSVDRTWQPAAVVTSPEMEEELVRMQVTGRIGSDWVKKAEEFVAMEREEIKEVRVRGPFGMAAADHIKPPEANGDGKVLLIANAEGVLSLTAVMEDLTQSLSRPDDAQRRRVSRLHPIIESFVRSENKKFEVHILAVVKAVEGNKRFLEAVYHCLDHHNHVAGSEMLDTDVSKTSRITLSVHVTQWAAAGSGVECWRRMKKLGSEKKHDGKKDEIYDMLLSETIRYGTPDWEAVFRMCRYRWLDSKVQVLHWGDRAHAQAVRAACVSHSYDPHRKHLRPEDKTIFDFYPGDIPSNN